ncbi:PrgI family protein [Sedimentibacter sp. zth1]|uniref:PrgI family protein n=1 Tax=Sedimentibacter sp. zth1 TaxID=2816908 RepID=UPI001A92B7E7|nr:PrgI family protein [Sedimentibacter sp. zth1]QSX05458.1 PrgI family protein [Sedimentibacter sp. zth1]
MRSFKVPYGKILPDKIIYGRLTPKEAIFLGSIVLVFFFLFMMDITYIEKGLGNIILRIILLLIYSTIALVLAFKKKDIYDLDEYLILRIKYKFRKYKNTIYEKY